MFLFFNSIFFVFGWLDVQVELFSNDTLIDGENLFIGGLKVGSCIVGFSDVQVLGSPVVNWLMNV